jgi:hypothetical protein
MVKVRGDGIKSVSLRGLSLLVALCVTIVAVSITKDEEFFVLHAVYSFIAQVSRITGSVLVTAYRVLAALSRTALGFLDWAGHSLYNYMESHRRVRLS